MSHYFQLNIVCIQTSTFVEALIRLIRFFLLQISNSFFKYPPSILLISCLTPKKKCVHIFCWHCWMSFESIFFSLWKLRNHPHSSDNLTNFKHKNICIVMELVKKVWRRLMIDYTGEVSFFLVPPFR